LYRNNGWNDYYVDSNGIERKILYYNPHTTTMYFSFISILRFELLEKLFFFTPFIMIGMLLLSGIKKSDNANAEHSEQNFNNMFSLLIGSIIFSALIAMISLSLSLCIDFKHHIIKLINEPSMNVFMKYYGIPWNTHQLKIIPYEYFNDRDLHRYSDDSNDFNDSNDLNDSNDSNDSNDCNDFNDCNDPDEYIKNEESEDEREEREEREKRGDEDSECNQKEYIPEHFLTNDPPCVYESIDSYNKKLHRKYNNKSLSINYTIMRINKTSFLRKIFNVYHDPPVFYYVTENGGYYPIKNINIVTRSIHTSDSYVDVGENEPSIDVFKTYRRDFESSCPITYKTLYDCYKQF
jgi:hypothetical protein